MKPKDEEISVVTDKDDILHFIPCDESQKNIIHFLTSDCICGPEIQEMDPHGEKEKIWVHQKILH
jgi:hypothetical protein